ncbi:ACR024Wp [Eremothecium gossypii ATCC 10895]|uniref:Phosphoinositide phospholipase C n=1 Tax=Eremothecium gossypii (strain ATCC 10895 / CBS 109.51 / FGSC 9923 / NRRL Y-1056) TaxID=284811 RepID=Q75C92_EREGS|nr:ACR024Wp [Eremothecium gossypii ATCC 10895]AAS51251.1 ACR024Wp [Eremothecium gossypii ATCC 10895]
MDLNHAYKASNGESNNSLDSSLDVKPMEKPATDDAVRTEKRKYHGAAVMSHHQISVMSQPLTKGVRELIKKTTAFMSCSKSKPQKLMELGPMTYAHSVLTASEKPLCHMELESSSVNGFADTLQDNGVSDATLVEMWLIRVTRRKRVRYCFRISNGVLTWKDNRMLELDTIKDIRMAEMAKNYREQYDIMDAFASRWITIIYQVSPTKLKALHLIAPTQLECAKFYNAVLTVARQRRELMESISVPSSEAFANIHWKVNVSSKKADESRDTLSFEDVQRLCTKFHIYCSSNYLKRVFKIADVNRNGLLNFSEFCTFVRMLKKRHEVTEIWQKIAAETRAIDFEKFYSFLTDVQCEDMDAQLARDLFNEYSHEGYMDEDLLLKFLTAQPYAREIEEDYSRPLSEYFISSSHNTYLLGNQVGSMASVEGYIQALQQGCRSVEIDIWDSDDGPVVCHGKLTSSLPLRNVVDVINKYAFITSPYPLILSLEIHCRSEGQIIVKQLFDDILGPLIYVADHSVGWPSLRDLKHKIIIKSKKLRVNVDMAADIYHSTSSKGSSYDSEYDVQSQPSSPMPRRGMRGIHISKRKHRVIEQLLQISAIHGITFRNFSLPESKTPTHCFSLSERSFDNLANDDLQRLAIDKHNRRHLMRVYPHAFRYKSSNYDPIKCWRLGVQMVATNWQTYDLGQQLNQAMFRVTARDDWPWPSGYVRKPEYLLHTVPKTSFIRDIYEAVHSSVVALSLELLSAQLLPKPKLSSRDGEAHFAPYVVIEVLGDGLCGPIHVQNGLVTAPNQVTSCRCPENGFNPVWKTSLTATLNNTGFNFIRYIVKNADITLATCCIRLDYMKRGYRHIPLYSLESSRFIFSTLFVKTDYRIVRSLF